MNAPSQPPPLATRQFAMEMVIAASKASVWKALTDEAELCRWFAPEARIDAQVGGEIVWTWGDLYVWPQRIEVLEPGVRLRTRYQSSVADAAAKELKTPLFVDFFLEGEGGSTTLRLCHSGFGAEASFDEEYDGISRGWPVELRSLRLYLERHLGNDRQIAWSTMTTPMPRAEAWQLLTGEGGFASNADIQRMSEGEAFELAGDVTPLAGKVLRCNPYEFTAVAENHGDAFLRISLEKRMGQTLVWVWLACYGQREERVTGMQQHWDNMLHRLFARHEKAATTEDV